MPCRPAISYQPSPDWCNRYQWSWAAARGSHAAQAGRCPACKMPWPCPICTAGLDAVQARRRDRDRGKRNEAIRHSLAVWVPLGELSSAVGLTRERVRQIGWSA